MRTGLLAALLVALVATHSRAGAPGFAAMGADAPVALFFGSSTTTGVGASSAARRWSSLLARDAGWREVNAGFPGTTLTDRPGPGRAPSAEARWRALVGKERPAFVFVMYGANDARMGVPIGTPTTPGTFRHAAATVVRGLRAAFPDAVVVLVTPQPARRLLGVRVPYDAALEAEAVAAGVLLVDGAAAFPASALADHAADAIHLNDRGHAAFALHVAGVLARAGLVATRGRAE
ncbi:MAG TPA: SGNH/GDSL hydrolase family protein [Anaeromyxobacteraceae bacterium]|nr:SGNH/GDSL hydrolase family protein [Anaeromyxobacteraceae bacterium]